MKRSVLCGLSVAALVLSLGLVGCGGGGIEEGAPTGNEKPITLDPKLTDMTGRSFDSQSKATKAAKDAKEADAAKLPAEEKKP